MPITLDESRLEAFSAVLPAIARFKRAFGRDLSPDFVAELYAARQYGLVLPDRCNQPGADAADQEGRRYQIKYRSPSTLNVDINNFNFDFIVLVNVDDDYRLAGMWRLPVAQARAICVNREKFRKFQVTQSRFKAEATRLQATEATT